MWVWAVKLSDVDRRDHIPLERLGEDAREAYAHARVNAVRIFRTTQSPTAPPSVPHGMMLTCGTAKHNVKHMRPHRCLKHQEASGQAEGRSQGFTAVETDKHRWFGRYAANDWTSRSNSVSNGTPEARPRTHCIPCRCTVKAEVEID